LHTGNGVKVQSIRHTDHYVQQLLGNICVECLKAWLVEPVTYMGAQSTVHLYQTRLASLFRVVVCEHGVGAKNKP